MRAAEAASSPVLAVIFMCICRSFGSSGTFWPGRQEAVACAMQGQARARTSHRVSRADYGRTILMLVLTIIAMVLKTSRDAYENDQFSRSERS